MRLSPTLWKRPLPWLLCAGLGLQAQELAVSGGYLTTERFRKSYPAWQVDYQQDFSKHFMGSIAYINEGHRPGHHRDGNATELWFRLPADQGRLAFAFGAGVYDNYDTQPTPAGGSVNVHGTFPIFSASATGFLSHRIFYRASVNQIVPAHDPSVTTGLFGVGVWFGREEKPTPGEMGHAPAEKGYVTGKEVALFAGQSVVNTLFSQQARAYAAEFRRGLGSHIDGTVSAIYEGDPEIVRRSGVAMQAWAVNHFFSQRVSLGLGIGPYLYIDRKHPRAGNPRSEAALAPLVSLTFGAHVAEHWLTRVTWDRVTSSYNRDSDIFLWGLGYHWAQDTD